jgi:hypothetical protein
MHDQIASERTKNIKKMLVNIQCPHSRFLRLNLVPPCPHCLPPAQKATPTRRVCPRLACASLVLRMRLPFFNPSPLWIQLPSFGYPRARLGQHTARCRRRIRISVWILSRITVLYVLHNIHCFHPNPSHVKASKASARSTSKYHTERLSPSWIFSASIHTVPHIASHLTHLTLGLHVPLLKRTYQEL